MTILSSKTPLRQDITLFDPHGLTASTRNDEIQIDSNSGIVVVHDSKILPVKRLVVLVPNVDMDDIQIARQVWEMASSARLAVILLSICADDSDELQLERKLTTLAALIRDPHVKVETHIEYSQNWRRGVKSILDDGDVILCHAEQNVGLRHKPLVSVLDVLPVPVWTLSGFYPSNVISHPRWLAELVFWLGAVAIVAGFFYLQIQINILPTGWVKSVVLALSVLAEFGSILALNTLFT
jgi:hypothetical protein